MVFWQKQTIGDILETWLDVDEFPLYEVSSEGRVRNKRTRHILKHLDNKNGAMMVILHREGMGYSRAVRRLVANAFNPIGDHDAVVVHCDDDFTNCRADNLDWRPRWQAKARRGQARRTESIRPGRIQDARTGEEWENALVAARAIDGLEMYVLTSAFNDTSYKGRYFRFI